MIYRGTVSGSTAPGRKYDVPSSLVGGATVANTIPHSTMGDLVVGDYDLQGVAASGNAFIYNMATGGWTIFNAPFGGTNQLTTAYGIWQNGIGSSSYTIAGGSNAGARHQSAYLVNYNSITGAFSNLKYYTIDDRPGVLSHFDGITAVPGGFDMVALGIHSALASVRVNADGSFSNAELDRHRRSRKCADHGQLGLSEHRHGHLCPVGRRRRRHLYRPGRPVARRPVRRPQHASRCVELRRTEPRSRPASVR